MDKYTMLKGFIDNRIKIMIILSILLFNVGVVLNSVDAAGPPTTTSTTTTTTLAAGSTTTITGDESTKSVQQRLACLICRITNLFFYVAGAIASLVIVIAGIRWVGSGEDPGARASAKNSVISAIVGLIIVLLAVFLVNWLVDGFFSVSQDPTAFVSGCATTCEITAT